MDQEAQPLAEYPVVIPVSVHWGEMDAYLHLNNTVYFRYFESARIAYFQPAGLDKSGIPKVAPILASTSCRFKAPITFPDSLQVGARVIEVGKDRFLMEYAIWSRALGRIAATGEGLVVSFDYSSGKKISLPQQWRDAIAKLERDSPGKNPGAGADS